MGGALALARGCPRTLPSATLRIFLRSRRFSPAAYHGGERIRLDLPATRRQRRAVPMKLIVDGPFAPGPYVKAIRLFSQRNPVPEMATFEFPVAVERVEVGRGSASRHAAHRCGGDDERRRARGRCRRRRHDRRLHGRT
jgi:hypothetical protein